MCTGGAALTGEGVPARWRSEADRTSPVRTPLMRISFYIDR